ncbi:hypothetical protein GF412_00160 [Candidatus Micrarchaeota archaeon]|nr:hypothetical protein [Candidatus Micrarchaeota archaeon]MBD3417388.1 hypothetical protein [Candidatus Micrarchaeota archaeon]
MKNMLVFLVALGLIFSPVFAGGDDDYDGFNLEETTPSGNPVAIWNCDWDENKGYQMHVELYLETPFEENRDVEIYAYKPSTDEWVPAHTCTNVDSDGKDCEFYFPVVWGMSETNTAGYADLLKAELVEGENLYSKKFNFYVSHTRTNREEVIYEKIDEFETMLAACPSKEDEFSEVVADATALGVECQLDDARTVLTDAINEIKDYQEAGECEVVTEQPDKPKESIPSEATKPGEEEETEEPEPAGEESVPEETLPSASAPSTSSPAESTDEDSMCPVGLVLLLAAAACFMRRE